jgi:NADH:ubiquinone oxidoreductase subunit F (NADH-binding)
MLMAAGQPTKMTKTSILQKLEASGLTGRGGGGFSVFKKWELVESNLKDKASGYIIVNGAEGEPEVKKDAYLLDKKTGLVVEGINLALSFLGKNKIKTVYFYLSYDYERLYKKKIEQVLASKKYISLAKKVKFFTKPLSSGYIGGEESAILNIIEGKRACPRLRPPFPVESGLFQSPTLIHNIETFYSIALVSQNKYQNKRLYTLSGSCRHKGVYFLDASLSIDDILQSTDNYPEFPFFVISGGSVCGEVLDNSQLSASVEGSGLIMIFNHLKTDYDKLLNYWLKYYEAESCGLCTPCREGSYRLKEIIEDKKLDANKFQALLDNLEVSTFCALGSSLPVTVKSYLENIYFKYQKNGKF